MVRLPAALERKLTQVFPKTRDRDRFVADLVTKALERPLPETTEERPEAIGGTLSLFTDGGSRGNPGQAAIGCVLLDPMTDKILKDYSETIGIVTNNIAEYQALIAGLKLAKQFHPNRLICHLDSELVVRQLNGEYRVKMQTFEPLIEEIRSLRACFPDVQFKYIPRIENARADMLVNRALDSLKK